MFHEGVNGLQARMKAAVSYSIVVAIGRSTELGKRLSIDDRFGKRNGRGYVGLVINNLVPHSNPIKIRILFHDMCGVVRIRLRGDNACTFCGNL